MRQWLLSHLTYSNVMVTILAFIVLGGGSAVALSGSNTVFSDDIANDNFNSPTQGQGGLVAADLRPSSVGTSEVVDNSLTGADINESSLVTTTLPSGRTLRGVFGLYGHGEENNGLEAASGDVSFNPPLASAPSVKVVQFGTASSPPECPGTAASPQAAPGWLCVYENRAQNQRTEGLDFPDVSAPGSGNSPTASRFGASLIVQGQASGTDWFYWSEGTWAVKAP
jgi:hypothetical protein